MAQAHHIAGQTYHGRRGGTNNAFRYSIDYVLIDAENTPDLPALFARNGRGVMLGHVFNPVSFWLCYDRDDVLRVVIAEVSNTFGDRHSYVCHHDDLRKITKAETITAQKVFHVSPFQDVAGSYTFRFNIQPESIGIWIDFSDGPTGLIATLTGAREPLTNASILKAIVRRPLGSRRVLALIHWQAIKLWWKNVRHRARPKPPVDDVSR